MTLPTFADAWHLDAAAIDVERRALATGGSGVSSVNDYDLAGAGARTMHVASNSWVELPLDGGDPGPHWTLHFWWRVDGGGFNRLSHSLRDGAGQQGVWIVSEVPAASPSARRLSIRHGSTTLFTFPNGSAATAAAYQIEVIEHATAGVVRAWRAGDLLYEESDIDTSRSGTADRLRLGPGSETSLGRHGHVILTPGAPLGTNPLVGRIAPASDEGPNDFTRSDTGIPHYQHLTEAPHDGDTTRLDADTVGDVSRHRVETPDLSGREVIALRPTVVYRGDGRLGTSIHSGSASAVDSDLGVVGATYEQRAGGWLDADPDTDAAWTAAGIGAVDVDLELLPEES
jgi:hypothetical protein